MTVVVSALVELAVSCGLKEGGGFVQETKFSWSLSWSKAAPIAPESPALKSVKDWAETSVRFPKALQFGTKDVVVLSSMHSTTIRAYFWVKPQSIMEWMESDPLSGQPLSTWPCVPF